jgi:hypothetical protein
LDDSLTTDRDYITYLIDLLKTKERLIEVNEPQSQQSKRLLFFRFVLSNIILYKILYLLHMVLCVDECFVKLRISSVIRFLSFVHGYIHPSA